MESDLVEEGSQLQAYLASAAVQQQDVCIAAAVTEIGPATAVETARGISLVPGCNSAPALRVEACAAVMLGALRDAQRGSWSSDARLADGAVADAVAAVNRGTVRTAVFTPAVAAGCPAVVAAAVTACLLLPARALGRVAVVATVCGASVLAAAAATLWLSRRAAAVLQAATAASVRLLQLGRALREASLTAAARPMFREPRRLRGNDEGEEPEGDGVVLPPTVAASSEGRRLADALRRAAAVVALWHGRAATVPAPRLSSAAANLLAAATAKTLRHVASPASTPIGRWPLLLRVVWSGAAVAAVEAALAGPLGGDAAMVDAAAPERQDAAALAELQRLAAELQAHLLLLRAGHPAASFDDLRCLVHRMDTTCRRASADPAPPSTTAAPQPRARYQSVGATTVSVEADEVPPAAVESSVLSLYGVDPTSDLVPLPAPQSAVLQGARRLPPLPARFAKARPSAVVSGDGSCDGVADSTVAQTPRQAVQEELRSVLRRRFAAAE
jgi:hypothetical protein